MIKAPIYVNESTDIHVMGDLTIHLSVEEAGQYFEPWYVDEPHFVFDAEGFRLEMTPAEGRYGVEFARVEESPSGREMLKNYLISDFESLAARKGWRFLGIDANWLKTAPLEELVEQSKHFAV